MMLARALPLACRVSLSGLLGLAAPIALASAGCSTRQAADYGVPTSQTPVRGDGATQPAALYEAWTTLYRSVDPASPLAYHGSSSSAGVEALKGDQADFAASDTPVDESKLGFPVVQVPTALVAVAVVYRLDGVTKPIELTAQQVSRLMQGETTDWRDFVAAGTDPAKIPKARVVLRSEASGTTRIFTDWLSSANPASGWQLGRTPQIPATVGSAPEMVASNDAVIQRVQQTNGALAFVSYAAARASKLQIAAIRNPDGTFVVPTLAAISAAALSVTDVRASLVNRPGADSYPIVSFTYAIARQADEDAARGRAVAHFLWWACHEGQRLAPGLGFATLPAEIVVQVETKLRGLRAGGEQAVRGM
jgi:phosphate transport system substrate-binding protein